MSKEMHPCAVPTCERRCSLDYLMCRPHWASVPKGLQNQIWNTWQVDPEGYDEAVEAALAHVAAKANR
jgi:hypothetical protein